MQDSQSIALSVMSQLHQKTVESTRIPTADAMIEWLEREASSNTVIGIMRLSDGQYCVLGHGKHTGETLHEAIKHAMDETPKPLAVQFMDRVEASVKTARKKRRK